MATRVDKSMLISLFDKRMDNELEILRSDECVCACCGKRFSAREVKNWDSADGRNFALCPGCCLPYVVPDSLLGGEKISESVKNRLHNLFFARRNDEDLRDDLIRFCRLYVQKRIEIDKKILGYFLTYATVLETRYNYPFFLLDAARDIASGAGVIEPSPLMAIDIIEHTPALRNSVEGLEFLLSLYFAHKGAGSDKAQEKKAAQIALEAISLGSIHARSVLAGIYSSGIGVKANPERSASILDAFLPEALDRLTVPSFGPERIYLAEFFLDYGLFVIEADENQVNYRDLVRFLLYAKVLAYGENGEFAAILNEQIEEELKLAEEAYGNFHDAPLYDQHCFYDTFIEYSGTVANFIIDSCVFDASKDAVSLTLSPSSRVVLVDTSTGSVRVAENEAIRFTLNGAIACNLPLGPIVFQSLNVLTYEEEGKAEWEFMLNGRSVGSIQFDLAAMDFDNDADEEENG